MKSVAIITARGGSKRIPRKNIKSFCGKPIIAYSIEAALNSGVFETVMVSTDDKEIADISQKYGAEVPFLRSQKTSNDFATTADVIMEVLEQYRENDTAFDAFCCIYPTAPFVSDSILKEAMEKLESTDVDTVMPVVRFSFPPQRALCINEGIVSFHYPEFATSRSQDLEPLFHDCGQFYACRVNSFQTYQSIVMPKTQPIIIPEMLVQDIDNLSDWQIAEIKYKQAFCHGESFDV